MPDLQTIFDTTILVLAIPTAVIILAAVVGSVCCRHRLKEYWLNLLIWLDQGVNTVCGGSPDETISSACYRFGARIPPKSGLWWCAYKGVNLLFFWQRDHCRGAYNSERERKHLPSEFQQQGVGHAESRRT